MIPNCEGCETEWQMLVDYVKKGKFAATSSGRELFAKGHLRIAVVDEDGELFVW